MNISKKIALAGFMLLAACTQHRPQYFPNEYYQRTSLAQRQADEEYCIALADEYVQKPNAYWDVAKQGAIGGVVGAGTGAVGGAIFSEAGRGTGAGAAIGAMLGVLKGIKENSENSPSYQRFVEHCMQKKGYEITGWGAR